MAPARAFRAIIIGLVLWVCGRVISHNWQDRQDPRHAPPPRPIAPRVAAANSAPNICWRTLPSPALRREGQDASQAASRKPPAPAPRDEPALQSTAPVPQALPESPPPLLNAALTPAEEEIAPSSNSPTLGHQAPARLQLSSWVFLRSGGADQPEVLAGHYGGSQIGLRARVAGAPLPRPMALSVRINGDLPDFRTAEAGLGLSYRPTRARALEFIAEGRVPLNRPGGIRPAFLIVGGWHHAGTPPRGTFQAYVQAGMVSFHRPLFFIDGGTRLTWATSPRSGVGAGLWGGAQGKTARLDIGPSIHFVRHGARVTADWRLRVAGRARPGSGPSLTLGKDF